MPISPLPAYAIGFRVDTFLQKCQKYPLHAKFDSWNHKLLSSFKLLQNVINFKFYTTHIIGSFEIMHTFGTFMIIFVYAFGLIQAEWIHMPTEVRQISAKNGDLWGVDRY